MFALVARAERLKRPFYRNSPDRRAVQGRNKTRRIKVIREKCNPTHNYKETR